MNSIFAKLKNSKFRSSFHLTIKDIKVSAGAGFIVVLTGNILTMPGLPKEPAAKRINIDENGKISGLF